MKVRLSNALIFIYSFSFFIFSLSQGFTFFDDARRYAANLPGYELESFLASIRFYIVPIFWLYINIIFFKVRGHGLPFFLFLLLILNPYILLLLTNFTKELLIIALGSSVVFSSSRVYFNGVIFLANFIRPLYVFWFIFYNKLHMRLLFLFILIALFIFAYFFENDRLSEFFYFLQSRSKVDHVGRDFFSYLCVFEKENLYTFIKCASFTFFALPFHNDFFSLGGVIYLFYCVAWFVASYYSYKMGWLWLGGFVFLYFAIFFMSPTFGAFLRYFTPVLFMVAFMRANAVLSVRS